MNRTTVKSTAHLVTSLAFFAAPAVWAEHDWQGDVLDETTQCYLTGTAENWAANSVPNNASMRFMFGGTTVTFNNMISGGGYHWVGATDGKFTDTDGNPLWCVWQSVDSSTDYGINASCKLAVSDASDQTGNLKILSGKYTFSKLNFGHGDSANGPARVVLSGGELKSTGMVELSGYPEATLSIEGGMLDTDAEFVIGTRDSTTGIVYQTSGTFTPKKFWVGSRYEYGQKAFGRYVMTGGSIATDSGQDFVVGGQDYSTGVVEVVSGTINVGGNLLVPWGGNSTGRMTVGDGAAVECGNFRLCDNAGGDGEYTQNGGTMTVRSAATIANTASRALATINGGKFSVSGNINVATAANGDGRLVLADGEMSSGGWVCIGANGNGCYVQKGGTFNITQAFISGQGSTPSATSYSIISNGTLIANELFIAENSTSSDMTIEGGTVAISSKAYMSKNSSEGRGTLTMNGGRLTIGDETYIANADRSTALVTLNGGELETTAAKKFYVGKGAGSKGEIVMGGGHLKVNNEIHLAPSSGSTGIVHVTSGTITNTSWLVLGINDAYHESMLRIDGGEVYNQGNVTLGSSMGNGSKDNLVVAGTGILRTTGNIYIAEGHTRDASNPAEATVTVEGGLVDNSAGETQFFYGNSIAGTTGTLNLNGGEYITKQIQYVNGAGTAKINFGGGKLKAASGSDSHIIWANGSVNMSATLVENTTSTIDTSSQGLTINVPIDGAGDIVVTGGGSLTLGAGMTYTGTTAVEAGTTLSLGDASATTSRLILRGGSVSAPANFSVAEVEFASDGEETLPSWYATSMKLIISGDTTLVVPQGTTLGEVEFKDNGKIVYTLSTYTAGETASVATIGTVTYPENETIADHIYISVDGTRMATVSNANGTLTAESREVEWQGTAGDVVDYSNAEQWSPSVPTGYDIIVFNSDAKIGSSKGVIKVASGARLTATQSFTVDSLRIGTSGAVLDTDECSVTVSQISGVEGSLGIAGSGSFTLGAAPAGSIEISLKDSVIVTVPYSTKLSALTFESRALLFVDVTGLDSTVAFDTPCPITLPSGYSNQNWFIAPKGKRAALDYDTQDGVKLTGMHTATDDEAVVNVFLGNSNSGSGEWRTDNQWATGAKPKSVDTVLLINDGTLTDNVADTVIAHNIVLKSASVKFVGGNTWPKIRAEVIDGIDGATLSMSCYGLGPITDKNLTVKVNVDVDTDNKNQDCWIEGNGAASRIAFYGGLYATNSAFRVNGYVDFHGVVTCDYTSDDDNYFNTAATFQEGSSLIIGPNGTVTINTEITFPGEVTVNGTLHEKAGCTFNSALKGAGTLNLSSGSSVATHFKGDNHGFSGTINAAKQHVPYLYSIDSGSSNAVWNINTDMRYVGEEPGTLKFGALNVSKGDWNWFYIRRELSNLVIEVGGRNDDMTWGEEYGFGGYNGSETDFNATDAKFRKVGSGVLHTRASNYPSIEVAEGVVSFEDDDGPSTSYVFSGGRFRFNSSTYPDPTVKFDLTNSSGPIDIDTAGHSFTWATAIKGAFDLIKRGEGTLALRGAHTYTGKTEVKGGVLILPYRDFGTQSVAVAEGAELHLDMTGVEVTENVSVPFFTTADAAVVDRVKLLGSADYTFQLSRNDDTGLVSYIPTAIDQDAPNTWIGGIEGDWNIAANWSRGIPQSTHTVQINSDVVIYSSTTYLNPLQIDTLDVQCQNFTFKAYNNDATPMLKVKAVTGPGKVTLCHSGLENVNGVEMTIANDIDFGASDNGYNSWIAANGAKVTMKGALTVLSTCGKFMMYGYNNLVIDGDLHVLSNINQGSEIGNTTINGAVLADGKFTVANCTINGGVTVNAKELRSSGCAFNGAFVIANGGQSWSKNTDTYTKSVEIQNGGILSTDASGGTAVNVSCPVMVAGTMNLFNGSSISGDVTLASTGVLSMRKNSSVSGKISGSGAVNTADGGNYTLSGDNSAFTGTFTHDANGVLVFNSAESGSAAAVWNLNGDVNTTTLASGTLKFGALNLYNQKLWYQNSNSTMTNEVGALGQDMQFGGNYFFGTESHNSGTNPENVTLKIVGGKLTNASYGIRKMVVAGGEMVLATPTHSDDAWESYKNDYAGYQIDSLVVEKGATLSGTTDQTVTSVKFEDGAYFGIALGDGNAPAMLTAGKFEFGKDVYGILSDAANANNGQIYAGTTMTGAPRATVLSGIGGTIAESSTKDCYWTTTHGDTGVWLNAAQVTETTVGTGESSSVAIRDADLAAWLAAGDATDKVNAANDNGVTGILAYMLGAEDYTKAAKPTMGATVADGVATLTFDDSAFRRVPGLKLAYYLESCDKADFSEAVTTSEPSDDPAVALEFANAKIFNRLCADVRASE